MYDTLILVNGEIPHQALWQSIPHRLLICTDGAANALEQTPITPDIIIGDMDSISDSTKRRYPKTEIISIFDQTMTDFEKALLFSEKMNFKKILCLGLLGKSADHSLYNLSLMVRFKNSFEITALSFLENEHQWIFPLRVDTRIYTKPHSMISFLAFPEAILSSQDLQWPLNQSKLTQLKHSLRNQTTGSQVDIHCEGDCLTFLTEDTRTCTQWENKVAYCNK